MIERLAWARRNPEHGENPKTDPTGNLKGEGTPNQPVFPGNGVYPVCGTVSI